MVSPQSVHLAFLPLRMGLVIPFAKLQKMPVSPVLQPVKALLNDSATIWCIIHHSQLFIICKLALCPVTEVVNKDITYYWPWY